MNWLCRWILRNWIRWQVKISQCIPGKGATLPFQAKWWALSWLLSPGYEWVQCMILAFGVRESFMKTPAYCLATMRKSNDRWTVISEGIAQSMVKTDIPSYKPSYNQSCKAVHLLSPCPILHLQPVKGPVMGMKGKLALWDSIRTRDDHVHWVSPGYKVYKSHKKQKKIPLAHCLT